ncbi:MAG: rod-binding protein [Lachnospiraceae bacterium]|nr:rod-binding protein [Lachnospiraceae bacterium]
MENSMDISGVGSAYADYLTSQASSQNASALKTTLESAASSTDEDELMDACKEFESYFLEQVFDAMLETTKVFSDEDEEDGYASKMVDYFKDFAVQELCDEATSGDGLGLANILYEQMKRNYGIGADIVSAEEV